MFYQLHNILRSCGRNGFITLGTRLFLVLLLALLLPVAASAYTIVMRGGHRIEIPDKFAVTQTTLTYESAPGLNVTLQMASIDIAATERANGEPQGSLLKRISQQQETVAAKAANAPRARKTLTNLDLEKSRRARIESEAAYERRRKELGLPSREETERRREEEAVRAREILNESEAIEAEAESYWRTRATALREEIYVLDAEMSYVRARLAEMPETLGFVSYANLGRLHPFIFSAGAPLRPRGLVNQSSFGIRQAGAQTVARVGFGGGQTRGHISLNYSNNYHSFRRRGFINHCRFAPCVTGFVETYPAYYSSYDRAALLARLRELEATRAGLQARWRLLEDEARRAGAQPGWLRQ